MRYKTLKTMARLALIVIALAVVMLIAAGLSSSAQAILGNRGWFDTTYHFDLVQIAMPDGSAVDGKVDSWLEFEDSDAIQIVVNGVTYYTHLCNVVLISTK